MSVLKDVAMMVARRDTRKTGQVAMDAEADVKRHWLRSALSDIMLYGDSTKTVDELLREDDLENEKLQSAKLARR